MKITLANLSNAPFSGKAKIRVLLDGQEVGTEDVDASAQPLAAFTGEGDFTLKQVTLPLTTIGKHRIRVELVDNPNEDNNAQEVELWVTVPSGELFALDFDAEKHPGEMVQVNSVGANLKTLTDSLKPWSMEMIFRLDRPQFAELVSATGFHLYTTYNMANGIPDNALYLAIGNLKFMYTKANTITPGKWHHVAIVIRELESDPFDGNMCNVEIYIDGKLINYVDIKDIGQDLPSFGRKAELSLAQKFDGQLKLFRAWDRILPKAEVQQYNFQYCRDASGVLPAGCFAEFTFDGGPKNGFSYSSPEYSAFIVASPERIEAADGGIWMRLSRLVAGFKFQNQNAETWQDDTHCEILFAKGTPQNPVKGTIVTGWPAVELTYNGAPVDKDTEFNFRNPVVVTASATLFGKVIPPQTYTLTYREDASSACDLLQLGLEKSANPSLAGDVMVGGIEQTNTIVIPDGVELDPKRVKPFFRVSDDAKLYLNGVEVQSNTTEVDLSEPALASVVAANGTAKRYEVRLSLSQSISWTLPNREFTYGDGSIPAGAESTSHLPLSFQSSNPLVASVVNGELHLGVPGSTTITAYQHGEGAYRAAETVQQTVTVKKGAVTVTPRIPDVKLGSTPEWIYSYTGLVKQEDTVLLPNPMALGAFRILNDAGEEQAPDAVLPLGIYSMKASEGSYSTPLYTITPADGQFSVVQGKLWAVAFTVVDANANPVPQASVMLDNSCQYTDTQGHTVFYLPASRTYEFHVGKAGFGQETLSVTLVKGQPESRTVTLKPATLTLSYTHASGGALAGRIEQAVPEGNDGDPVWALPEVGYAFTAWSDGVKDNPRTDRQVRASLEVEAKFEPKTFRVRYSVAEGGSIASGSAEQTVGYDQEGSEITVAAQDADHYFMGWSDGYDSPTRKEEHVQADVAVTALFGEVKPLPGSCNFENGTLGDWYTLGAGVAKKGFSVTSTPQVKGAKLQGYYAVIDGMQADKQAVEGYLYSPVYRLSSPSPEIEVGCQYMLASKDDDDASLTLEYRLDDDPWTEAGVDYSNSTPDWQSASIEEADLAVSSSCRFVGTIRPPRARSTRCSIISP